MAWIPRFLHGIIDYVYAALLIASPWIFRFHQEREADIAIGLGAAVVVYASSRITSAASSG